MDNFKNVLDPLPNMSKEWKPLKPYKHDRYLTPELLKVAVLESPRIQELSIEIAQSNGKQNVNDITKLIEEMLDEIGFSFSLPIIRTLGICLNKIFMGMTSGVYVHRSSIDLIKSALSSGECPVIYLPSHRSYADFILMSYICFVHDMEIPAIAAGMDFHAMIAMGTLLRFTGAFFIRRSFSQDKIYWNVFKEYVRMLMTQYHAGLEFFIEGTRSRSNKALTPKIGLLSMALEPFFNREIYDVIVVPVGVAYDKILEEVLFAYELLGVPKPRESTMRFFRALSILEVNHGNMFIKFGEPISLKRCWDNFKRTISKDKFITGFKDKGYQHEIINHLAYEVVDAQQKLIVITVFNLITIYFCYRRYVGKDTHVSDLAKGVKALQIYLEKCGANVAINNSTIEPLIKESLEIHNNLLKISSVNKDLIEIVKPNLNIADALNVSKCKGHKLTSTTMFNTIPLVLLQLYANPCLHWLHIPAFYILARHLTTDKDEVLLEVRKLRQIFCTEFVTDKFNPELIEQKILAIDGAHSDLPELNNVILSAIGPYLYCYLNVVEVILKQANQTANNSVYTFTEKELYVNVQKHVERKLMNPTNALVHPFCLCLDTISNAITSLSINSYSTKLYSSNSSSIKYAPNLNKLEELYPYLQNCCEPFKQFSFVSDNILITKL